MSHDDDDPKLERLRRADPASSLPFDETGFSGNFEALKASKPPESATRPSKPAPDDELGLDPADLMTQLPAGEGRPETGLGEVREGRREAVGPLQLGARLDDHYEILDVLGSGGMGAVYRARDLRLGRLVAVKAMQLLDEVAIEEQLRVFRRDAVATAQLRHPNVVTIFDYGVHAETPYIVLELLEGQSVQERLDAAEGKLPVEEVLGIGTQVLAALAHAHDAGVYHRDLKPGNVFLVDDGPVKVLDFGMAELDMSRSSLKAVTGKATAALRLDFGEAPPGGSPGYMAPEQWQEAEQGAPTDLWALGVMLYQMLTGQLPTYWEAVRAASWGLDEVPDRTEALKLVPSLLRPILTDLLAWKPSARPQSAREVAKRLEEAAEAWHARQRPALTLEPGAVVDGRFELLERLGAGGFGVVFKARQISTGQHVAVKILHGAPPQATEEERQTLRDRFEREMQVIAQLKHPNIVRLIDYGELDGGRQAYLVLEFIEGTTLSKLIQEQGALSEADTRHLMTQVLDALIAAHESGIVHRDLKPDNIIVTSTGGRRNAMVLDFGIAGVVEGENASAYQKLTRTNEVVGTPNYMAPEQLLGRPVTPQSDIYAWGLVTLECLTGKTVVDAESGAAIIFQHLAPDPIEIDDAVAATRLGQLLHRAVDKRQASRFASAAELLAALDGKTDAPLPAPPAASGRGPDTVKDAVPGPPTEPYDALDTVRQSAPRAAGDTPTEAALAPARSDSGGGPIKALVIAVIVAALLAVVALIVLQTTDRDGEAESDEETTEATTAPTPVPPDNPLVDPDDPNPVDPVDPVDPVEPDPPQVIELLTVDLPAREVTIGLTDGQLDSLKAQFPDQEIDFDFGVLSARPFQRRALGVMPVVVDHTLWNTHLERAADSLDAVCGGPRVTRPPSLTEDAAPVTSVGAAEAEAFCQAVGARLPTSEEWEAIARGPEGRIYSFGSSLNDEQVIALTRAAWPPPGFDRTPEGVMGLSGGVWEWVRCRPGEISYCQEGFTRMGGAWSSMPAFWVASLAAPPIEGTNPTCYRDLDTGFRCVVDSPAP